MKQLNLFVLCGVIMSLSIFNSQTLTAQIKRALIVGISDYGNAKENPNMWSNISGANDVKLLTPLFQKQGYKVTTLADSQATYSNITNALKKITKEATKGDIVYLHFSMHGQPFEDLNGDEADGWDEALIPVDAQMYYQKGVYEGEKHLIDDELEKYFDKIRSKIGTTGKLYAVFDACHSGTASRGDDEHVRGIKKSFSKSGKNYTPDRTKEDNDYFKLSMKKGLSPATYIEACRSYQQNKEVKINKVGYGSLSYYIAEAMKKHSIGLSEDWIDVVRIGMRKNRKLHRQNMVIEKSK